MGKLSNLKKGVEKFLDMAQEARMQRARDMGYRLNMPLYHGTTGDVEAFDLSRGGDVSGSPVGALGVSASLDPETAAEFANLAGNEGANIMKVYHRAEQPASIDLAGDETNYEIAAAVQDAWDAGYDAIKFNNYTTPGGQGGRSFVLIKDPSQIRSVNAAFDPAQKDSPNLLASMGGAAVLGGAAMAPEDVEAAYQQEQYGQAVKGAANKFVQKRMRRRGIGSNPEVGAASRQQIMNAPLELMAGVNKGVVDTANFVVSEVPNALLQLSGSDQRVNSLYDIPGVSEATQGGFMAPGKDRENIYGAGQLLSPL